MRNFSAVLALAALLSGAACKRRDEDSAARDAGRDAHKASEVLKEKTDQAARAAGKAAHEISRQTGKAVKEAGKEIKHVAGEAREGWKEGDDAKPKNE